MRRYVNGERIELARMNVPIHADGDRLVVERPNGPATAVRVVVGDTMLISYQGAQYRVERSAGGGNALGAVSGELRALMPGQITDVKVVQGETVQKGATIFVLEAMKTQQPYVAPFDGVVTELTASAGAQVAEGETLAVIAAPE